MTSDNNETAIEPVPIQDTFITGVDRVEFLGNSIARIYLYSEAEGQRVIVGKMVMAIEHIPDGIMAVLKATRSKLLNFPWEGIPEPERIGRH